MFLVVDGIDGAGKTTLAGQLAQCLSDTDPFVTKEPTNISPWGRRLRESAVRGRLPRDEELEFFHKDRLWHLDNVIEPALAAGRAVISDRYVDSTLAFQTNSPAEADALYDSFVDEIRVPDITFILRCPVDTGLERIHHSRGKITKFENVETLENARAIYQSRSGPNYCFLNASGTIQETIQQALSVLADRYPDLSLIEDCYSESPSGSLCATTTLRTAAGS